MTVAIFCLVFNKSHDNRSNYTTTSIVCVAKAVELYRCQQNYTEEPSRTLMTMSSHTHTVVYFESSPHIQSCCTKCVLTHHWNYYPTNAVFIRAWVTFANNLIKLLHSNYLHTIISLTILFFILQCTSEKCHVRLVLDRRTGKFLNNPNRLL